MEMKLACYAVLAGGGAMFLWVLWIMVSN